MKISKLDADSKYWVVRAGTNAVYFQHFKQNDIIALGHMDEVEIAEDGCIDGSHIYWVEREVREIEGAKDNVSSNQITQKLTQIKTFITAINIGDTILTLDKGLVLAGTVLSDPYIEGEELKIKDSDGIIVSATCSFKLRRKVKWGSTKERTNLPSIIRSSITAQQTLFSLDKYREPLNHWLYSMFILDNSFYFSTRIDQEKGISQFHLIEFQRVIQKLELITEIICNKQQKIDTGNIELFFNQVEKEYELKGLRNAFTLTTKNEFMSPGNLWSKLEGNIERQLVFAMLVTGMFSTNVMATNMDEEQIIKSHQREAALFVEYIKSKPNFELSKERLRAVLAKPNKEVTDSSEHPTDKKEVVQLKKLVFPSTKKTGDIGL
jgi:hypothetical protein